MARRTELIRTSPFRRMMATTNILMLFYLLLICLFASNVEGVYVSFPATSDVEVTKFYHLAVDPVTGTVFVGASNRLHQLDVDLRPIRTVTTGPRLDNRLCTESFGAARCGAGGKTAYDAVPTDNINKVFVKNVLIFCVVSIDYPTKGDTGYKGKLLK